MMRLLLFLPALVGAGSLASAAPRGWSNVAVVNAQGT